MDLFTHIIQYILHIDVYLNAFVSNYGFLTYFLLFLIVFCETGLVVTPFLPGDSLLFAAGSIAAQPDNSLNSIVLIIVLILASVLGNQINFFIGSRIGPKIATIKTRFLNKSHLEKAHSFYVQHGGKTIIFARFLPILRTFAPFIAGIGKMNVQQFTIYNMLSAFLWVGSLVCLGYFLGSLTVVKEHFTVVIYGIIAVSLLPAFLAFFRKKSPPESKSATYQE